jgi:hypothetical protein
LLQVDPKVPRLLINKELPPEISGFHLWTKLSSFTTNQRKDYAFIGQCDDAVRRLAARIGWEVRDCCIYETS